MSKNVFVKLFRFDTRTDYLPYYKNYELKYSREEKVVDLLNKINKIESFVFSDKLQINGLFLNTDARLDDVIKETGNRLSIAPISTFRVVKDLSIDNSDFEKKIELFDEFLDDKEKEKYKKLHELEYYASNTLVLDQEYIGDHTLFIASDIIQKNPDSKDTVLRLIASKENGIWYHTSLENRVLNYDMSNEEKIVNLLKMLPDVAKYKNKNEVVSIPNDIEVIQHFTDFNIASYDGLGSTSLQNVIEHSGAKYIDITSKTDDLSYNSTVSNKEFLFRQVGNILLEAKDTNVDFLIVRGKHDAVLFDKHQKDIEKIVGRDIALPIVTREQYKLLLEGEKDAKKLGFDSHKVDITFL